MAPFLNTSIQWKPPSTDPTGPSAQRDLNSADFGGCLDYSHAPRVEMTRTRSTPSLAKTDAAFARELMLERFPLMAELKRWENRGKMMEERESRGMKTTMRTREQ